jgi:hypothetical protein
MGDHISKDERLRRIGEILLRAAYLWANAAVGAGSSPGADLHLDAISAELVCHETDQAPAQDTPHPARTPRRVATRTTGHDSTCR